VESCQSKTDSHTHRIASHRIASHRIASHRIASHRIASHRIASHRIASHRLTSHRIASHRCVNVMMRCDARTQIDCHDAHHYRLAVASRSQGRKAYVSKLQAPSRQVVWVSTGESYAVVVGVDVLIYATASGEVTPPPPHPTHSFSPTHPLTHLPSTTTLLSAWRWQATRTMQQAGHTLSPWTLACATIFIARHSHERISLSLSRMHAVGANICSSGSSALRGILQQWEPHGGRCQQR
jgi:Ni/Co efflux regulator RcnB